MSVSVDRRAPALVGTAPDENAVEVRKVVARDHEQLLGDAAYKVASILTLTRDLPIRSVVEIGAGSGAVLETLDRHGFAERYCAIEPSAAMCDFIRSGCISRLDRVDCAIVDRSALRTERFDLAILTHVLEHLEDPATVLSAALGMAAYVLVEVPIEGSMLGNLRAWIKTRVTGRTRTDNFVGHIQFFSIGDVHRMVQWCGGTVVRHRLYDPSSAGSRLRDAQLRAPAFRTRLYARVMRTAARLLGPAIWSRIYLGHYAVLIERRAARSADERQHVIPSYYTGPC